MSEKQIKTIKNTLIKSAISCIAIFCLLALSLFLLLGNMSLSWFASNNSVDTEKMDVRIKGTDIEVAYYYKTEKMDDYSEMSSPTQMFEELMPGDRVSIKVQYTNNDDRSFALSLYLDYEDGFETPIESEEKHYYYLSSQLKVNDIPMLDGAIDGVYFTEPQTPQDIYFGSIENINPGETKELEFTITFVNLDENQNVYQNFTQKCIRVIHTDYTENK